MTSDGQLTVSVDVKNTGAVAGAYYGVPDNIREKAYTYIPTEFVNVIENFERYLTGKRKKTIVYLHGFASNGQSSTVGYLSKRLPECNVLAPDIPINPFEAMPFLQNYCKQHQADLIIGTSMGAMYAMQLTDYPRICVNPALRMSQLTDILKPGTFEFFQPNKNGEAKDHPLLFQQMR